ncbi:MAG: hypothetical protein MUC55_04585 [Burkholderiales bacterium]|nr:hypothetical protein [Burkholderiales bacterium]
MEWLGQNWIWVVAAVAFLLLMSRGGLGHHGHGGSGFGGGHGGHGGGDFGGGRSGPHGPDPRQTGGAPGAASAIDPVSGNAVRTDRALTSVHGGDVFYFESAETRQRFEAEPDKYVANATAKEASTGQPSPRRHRHGC